MIINKVTLSFLRVLRLLILILGSLFLMMAVFATTRVPFDVHRWLGTSGSEFAFTPDHIVMLGGSGMPSESNLIRLYYTQELAQLFPEADVIICHPEDSSVMSLMTSFLKKTILPYRIHTRSHGASTREQVIDLLSAYPGIAQQKVIVVTSPENMYRTVRSFRKMGCINVGGVSAFENAMFTDLTYNYGKVGGKAFVPDVSGNLALRYNFWNYLKLEITCMREMAAIFYYKLNGWI